MLGFGRQDIAGVKIDHSKSSVPTGNLTQLAQKKKRENTISYSYIHIIIFKSVCSQVLFETGFLVHCYGCFTRNLAVKKVASRHIAWP